MYLYFNKNITLKKIIFTAEILIAPKCKSELKNTVSQQQILKAKITYQV